jgi:hypothetical protein
MSNAFIGIGLMNESEAGRSLCEDYTTMSKFLNRILGMPVKLQNCLFAYLTNTMEELISNAKKSDTYDLGVKFLDLTQEKIGPVKSSSFLMST